MTDSKEAVDLNCDMGEGFGSWMPAGGADYEIMKFISSANVAAGFHAGDPNLMDKIAKIAAKYGVGLGVHPGYRDLQGFGRRYMDIAVDELINDITYQIGALREFGQKYGISLQHVKLHGALYMEAAKNVELSISLIRLMEKVAPKSPVFCMADSETEKAAVKAGFPCIREFYADRDYANTGQIVFTRRIEEKLDPNKVAQKCLRACQEGVVETMTGDTISIAFESICFHSDTPGALEIGRAVHETLQGNGIKIVPAAQLLNQ